MKSLARMYTWWPKIDEDIERVVKACKKCQENQSNVPSIPLQSWTRLHIDYAGPFMNAMFFIIVDAHSEWVEIFRTPSTTSATVI